MALLSNRERELLRQELRNPHLTEAQRDSLLRELKRDEESVSEGAVDTKLALARKR